MSSLQKILVVDDSPSDTELTLAALEDYNLANEIITLRDGVEALEYLFCQGAFADRPSENPAVVLLDLNMPKVGGLEVLQRMRAEPKLQRVPVVIMTASMHEKDILTCMELGVSAYEVKPVKFQEFFNMMKEFDAKWTLSI